MNSRKSSANQTPDNNINPSKRGRSVERSFYIDFENRNLQTNSKKQYSVNSSQNGAKSNLTSTSTNTNYANNYKIRHSPFRKDRLNYEEFLTVNGSKPPSSQTSMIQNKAETAKKVEERKSEFKNKKTEIPTLPKSITKGNYAYKQKETYYNKNRLMNESLSYETSDSFETDSDLLLSENSDYSTLDEDTSYSDASISSNNNKFVTKYNYNQINEINKALNNTSSNRNNSIHPINPTSNNSSKFLHNTKNINSGNQKVNPSKYHNSRFINASADLTDFSDLSSHKKHRKIQSRHDTSNSSSRHSHSHSRHRRNESVKMPSKRNFINNDVKIFPKFCEADDLTESFFHDLTSENESSNRKEISKVENEENTEIYSGQSSTEILNNSGTYDSYSNGVFSSEYDNSINNSSAYDDEYNYYSYSYLTGESNEYSYSEINSEPFIEKKNSPDLKNPQNKDDELTDLLSDIITTIDNVQTNYKTKIKALRVSQSLHVYVENPSIIRSKSSISFPNVYIDMPNFNNIINQQNLNNQNNNKIINQRAMKKQRERKHYQQTDKNLYQVNNIPNKSDQMNHNYINTGNKGLATNISNERKERERKFSNMLPLRSTDPTLSPVAQKKPSPSTNLTRINNIQQLDISPQLDIQAQNSASTSEFGSMKEAINALMNEAKTAKQIKKAPSKSNDDNSSNSSKVRDEVFRLFNVENVDIKPSSSSDSNSESSLKQEFIDLASHQTKSNDHKILLSEYSESYDINSISSLMPPSNFDQSPPLTKNQTVESTTSFKSYSSEEMHIEDSKPLVDKMNFHNVSSGSDSNDQSYYSYYSSFFDMHKDSPITHREDNEEKNSHDELILAEFRNLIDGEEEEDNEVNNAHTATPYSNNDSNNSSLLSSESELNHTSPQQSDPNRKDILTTDSDKSSSANKDKQNIFLSDSES